jgi:hypothetical protein
MLKQEIKKQVESMNSINVWNGWSALRGRNYQPSFKPKALMIGLKRVYTKDNEGKTWWMY